MDGARGHLGLRIAPPGVLLAPHDQFGNRWYYVLGRPWVQNVVSWTYKGGKSGIGEFGFGMCKLDPPLMGEVSRPLVDFLN